MKPIAALALLLIGLGVLTAPPPIDPDPVPYAPQLHQQALPAVVVLTLGDSNSTNGLAGGWQEEFCRQLQVSAGRTCDLRNPSVAGTGCGYWPPRVAGLMATHNPDLVIIACGTNDDTRTPAQVDAFGYNWRLTVEAVWRHRSPPVLSVPVLLQYADPYTAPQIVLDSLGPTNDAIYTNLQYYIAHGWFAGIVDWQPIPTSADYLVSTPADPAGLHRTARGQRYAGRLAYDRIAPGMGWPTSVEPPLCGLVGHRRPYPRPQVPLCPMGG